MTTRAGFVTLLGKPNAGKSTLLNRIVGQKLSIVSKKPQSTRDQVVGIHTAAEVQMVLFDTPGLLDPEYPLQRAMRAASLSALANADVIVYLVEGTDGPPPSLVTVAMLERTPLAPVLTVFNKMDRLSPTAVASLRQDCADALFISALTGDGIPLLESRIAEELPESPFLYRGNEIATQSTRYFVSELIRETALEQLGEEVPYSLACEIEEFREDRTPMYIRAVLYVEREGQKRILIGAGGRQIKQLGRVSRGKIEQLVDSPVFLDLWVKVLPNWRGSPAALARFGYRLPPGDPSR